MKQFIHLRGTMGSGKTSTARSVINQGNYEVKTIRVFGKEIPYTYDENKRWLVTGRYDMNECGGMDRYCHNKNEMLAYINALMKRVSPDVLIFEAVLYGITVEFGMKLSSMCRKYGYQYKGILLMPTFEVVLANLYHRNGGKPIDEIGQYSKYRSAVISAQTMSRKGIPITKVDSSQYDLDGLYTIVDAVL